MNIYYCLSSNGNLYTLGHHSDWEAAEDAATDRELDPIWVFDAESAKQWKSVLSD